MPSVPAGNARHQDQARDFPVVCVGGSAGGLDAYIRLLRHWPADLGAAIVIVNHLRVVATLLHEILPNHTTMPVELITEGLALRPNCVFIIPPQRDLHVLDGQFRLAPISKPRGWPDVITVFLRSMTKHWQGRVIAVIVSGYDGDGADALCAIRDAGGITIAQKRDTASQPDMPQSAIDTGCIDFVLAPEDIAGQVSRIVRGAAVALALALVLGIVPAHAGTSRRDLEVSSTVEAACTTKATSWAAEGHAETAGRGTISVLCDKTTTFNVQLAAGIFPDATKGPVAQTDYALVPDARPAAKGGSDGRVLTLMGPPSGGGPDTLTATVIY